MKMDVYQGASEQVVTGCLERELRPLGVAWSEP